MYVLDRPFMPNLMTTSPVDSAQRVISARQELNSNAEMDRILRWKDCPSVKHARPDGPVMTLTAPLILSFVPRNITVPLAQASP